MTFCLVKDGNIDFTSFVENKTEMLYFITEKIQLYKKSKDDVNKVQELSEKIDFENGMILYPIENANEPTNKIEELYEYVLGDYEVKENKVKRLWTTKERSLGDAKGRCDSSYREKKTEKIRNTVLTIKNTSFLLSDWLLQEDEAEHLFSIPEYSTFIFVFKSGENSISLNKTEFQTEKTKAHDILNALAVQKMQGINRIGLANTYDKLKTVWNSLSQELI